MWSWFKKLWKGIGKFFRKAAKTAIGITVEDMREIAIDIVRKLEQSDKSGEEKLASAKKVLEHKYPSAKSAAINLAIELAVAIVEEELTNN